VLVVVFLMHGMSGWALIHSYQAILVMHLLQEAVGRKVILWQCDVKDPRGPAADLAM